LIDPSSEFALIERFFKRSKLTNSFVAHGVGDDCALLTPFGGEQLAVSTDTLVESIHFFPDVDPEALGHKALAVNLSDLAACGATPRCFFLALALPQIDQTWLERFSSGLHALADAHHCVLAGGDTTRSPSGVVITITVLGSVPSGHALMRSGAKPSDDIWVSGELGDAALALAARRGLLTLPQSDSQSVLKRLERPTPRINLGERLRQVASSAIDVSDGLTGDLAHVLRASAAGAVVEWKQIPRSAALRRQPDSMQKDYALAGGDDYELLFTAPVSARSKVLAAASCVDGVAVTRIGTVTATADLTVLDDAGRRVETGVRGFDHFAPDSAIRRRDADS